MRKKRDLIIKVVLYALTILFLIPIYWLIVSSLKTDSEITRFPPTFWPEIMNIKNFPYVWKYLHFTKTFMNSIIVSISTTILIVIFSTMAGYAFAKKEFVGRKFLMTVLIGTMTIPATVLLLPLFFIITKLGMYDKLISLIFPFGVTVFGIFFMKQYIEDIPDALIEAARIDGCGEFRIFFTIILPLLKPAITSLTIIEFVNNWNSFTMPLVLLKTPEKFTLPLRLGMLAKETVAVPWSQIMAANVLTVIPVVIVFLLLQKYFIKGIMSGSVKG
ncbi:carbohydrate ABC transporter permease [Caldisalinibacter kiritimatiensis]|uniref:N-Acetyl-D-glucosamine ABC transport system, permease protein 2 n=1 Tax=Caldisalinibacter kiritimatiensis TaxID=1304284 RepID=R1CHN8_9FIRM|nr:carbohydrate ABC transporter permease [Caldisalinibacter kiritimatiensis]EOD01810.1 N-Acetyl-D-glucosamine ABC transport system, permease protein 2 [Caldisalinibacter kiritimatiensis]